MEPKFSTYLALAKSGVSMSGPQVGSMPTFFDDSQTEVWLTTVAEPSVFMKRSMLPPVRLRPYLSMMVFGSSFRAASSLPASSVSASSQVMRFHLPSPRAPTRLSG
ncbi:hypothetical protein D9M69_666650 [compost metagenome]